MACGVLVLVGWLLDVEVLKGGYPSITPMKPNAAVALVLGGVGLWLLRPAGIGRARRLAGRLCAGTMILIGALTLAEYVFGVDPGIDRLLFHDSSGFVGVAPPGRPGANAAAALVLLGAGLLALDVEIRKVRPAEILALTAVVIALLRLTGYLYGVGNSEGELGRWLNPMALNASIAVLVLAAAILHARPHRGIAGFIASPGVGGTITRRLVPPIVFGSILLGWLELEGEKHDLVHIEVGNSVMVTAGALAATALVAVVGRSLDRTARALAESEERLRRLNRELEQRVRQRTAEIEGLNAELQSSNSELEAFSYSVSHDLRAPLRAIDGFARLLVDEHAKELPEGGRHYVDRMLEGVGRMGTLTDGLLGF